MLNSNTIRFGDVYDITFRARRDGVAVDLTTATITLVAELISTGVDYTLTATGGTDGAIVHTLTGTLPRGTYKVTAEIVLGSDTATAPTEGNLLLTVR
jgi:hypothetical protein